MYTQIAANKRKSAYLIFGFILIVGVLGWIFSKVLGNPGLFIFVLVFSVAYAFFGYYKSDKIALMLSGAKPIAKPDAPELYRVIENLTITAGLAMPRVYIINDPSPNAFATGRDPAHAAVAVTAGLLEIMNKEELEGVIAHELSHVGNDDIKVMALVVVLVTIVVYASDFFLRMAFWGGMGDDHEEGNNGAILVIIGIVAAILAPLAAMLLQLAVSRKREYLADASGVLLTRYPEGLESALKKISDYPKGMKRASNATAHLYIANPLRGKQAAGWFANLFSTHPPIADRIKRLETMETKL